MKAAQVEIKLAGGHIVSCQMSSDELSAFEAALDGDGLIPLPPIQGSPEVSAGGITRSVRRTKIAAAAVLGVSIIETETTR